MNQHGPCPNKPCLGTHCPSCPNLRTSEYLQVVIEQIMLAPALPPDGMVPEKTHALYGGAKEFGFDTPNRMSGSQLTVQQGRPERKRMPTI